MAEQYKRWREINWRINRINYAPKGEQFCFDFSDIAYINILNEKQVRIDVPDKAGYWVFEEFKFKFIGKSNHDKRRHVKSMCVQIDDDTRYLQL